jgi:hypothetical protein
MPQSKAQTKTKVPVGNLDLAVLVLVLEDAAKSQKLRPSTNITKRTRAQKSLVALAEE